MSLHPPRIVTVPILPLDMLHSFILVGDRPVIVDSGVPGSAPKVLAALGRAGFAPKDVALILITHAHIDHIGSVKALRDATDAPVAVHTLDADWLRRGKGAPRPPTGLGGRLFGLTGLPDAHAQPCEPDVVFQDDLSLAPYGVPEATVRHTPGHTAGSVSVLLPNGDAITGDLVIGGIAFLGGIAFKGHARKPPFEDDPALARQSLIGLLDRGAGRFFVGHGGPLTANAVRRYVARDRSPRRLPAGGRGEDAVHDPHEPSSLDRT